MPGTYKANQDTPIGKQWCKMKPQYTAFICTNKIQDWMSIGGAGPVVPCAQAKKNLEFFPSVFGLVPTPINVSKEKKDTPAGE